MAKRLVTIIFLVLMVFSFVSSSEGFDNNFNWVDPNDKGKGQKEYTQEKAIQGEYLGGHDTITAEGMLLKEQVHQQTDPDGGTRFIEQFSSKSLSSLRIGAHDEDTNKWLNWRLKDPPIGSTGWGDFFDHFYKYDKNKSKNKKGFKGWGTPAPKRAKNYIQEIKKIAGCTPGGIDDLSGENRRKIYEYFGKSLHLLQDMAVPSHVQDDAHPFRKPFENYVGDNWGSIVNSQTFKEGVTADKYLSGNYKFTDISQYWDSLAKISSTYTSEEKLYELVHDPITGIDYYKLNEEKLKNNVDRLVPEAILHTAGYIDAIYDYMTGKTSEEAECALYYHFLGPGGDHADDRFDVSDEFYWEKEYGFSKADLADLYMRTAMKKGKIGVWYWKQYMELYMTAVTQYSDAPQETKDAIEANLQEIGRKLEQRDSEIDWKGAPDVALFAYGFYNPAISLMLKFKEPVAFIGLDFDPSIVKDHPIMIVPSGGFYGLENSEILRAKLDEYVKDGGTLIVFAQQHGYEFSILPVPQETDGTYNTITGYGWTEDQSCLWNGTYVDTYHQILSAINTSKSSANVDGYFISYPSNSTILLRRTANGQPAMLMYEYGNGRVIVSSLFSDWGYTHSQATQDEIKIVRDMVSWTKKPDQLPEIKQGETVSVSVSVKNNVDIDASSIKYFIYNPDRTTVVDEQLLAHNISAGKSAIIPISYTIPQNSALGIYHIDYELFNPEGNIIQPRAETDSGRFVVSNPPSNPYKSPDFSFSIQSDAERFLHDMPVTFTVIAWNKTNTSRTLVAKYSGAHLIASGSQTLTIPPYSSMSFQVVANTTSSWWARLWVYFYDEAGRYIGNAWKSVYAYSPSVDIKVQTDKTLYSKGETVSINASLKNNIPPGWQVGIKFSIVNESNTIIFEDTKTVNLPPNGADTVATSFTLPSTLAIGTYVVRVEALYKSELVSSASTSFELPQSQISVTPNLPSAFITGLNAVSFTLNNIGKTSVSSGNLDVSMKDPEGVLVYSGSYSFDIAVGQNKTLDVPISIPSLKFGNYTLIYTQSDETRTGSPTTIIIPNTVTIALNFDKPSYNVRGKVNLTVNLLNSGKFNLEDVSVAVLLPDVNYTNSQLVSLQTTNRLLLTYDIQIPETSIAGQYNANVTLTLPSVSSVLEGSKFTIPDAFIKIEHTGEKSLTTGDIIDLTVENTGGVDAQSIIEIKLTSISDAFTIYQDFISDTIQASTSKKYSFQIPLQARSDGYVLDAKVSGDVISTALLSEIIDISGIAANLLVRVDKDIFRSTENIISLSQIVNQTFGIDNADLHLQIVNKCASEVYVESYHISTWDGTSWVERGVLHYPETFETQNIDLSEYLPDVSGEYKVRISNLSIYAYVDYIGLIIDGTAYTPSSAINLYSNSSMMNYIRDADDYASNLRNLTAEIRWTDIPESTNKILSMRARELGYNLSSCQEQLYWQTDIPVTIASNITINTTDISGLLYEKGQFYLQGKLLSSTGQVIANAEYPFSVIDGNIALRIQTDKNVYRPGETVMVAGVVNNLAPVDALEIRVEISDNNGETIYSETFNISANGGHTFSFTTTAGVEGVYRLSGKVIQNDSTLIEISDRYEVARPNVSVSVNVPEVADKDSFNINVEIKNEGKAEAVISLQSSVDNQIQEMIIPAGETRLLQYTQQITGDSTYTFTFTGDIDQTITKTVLYGLSAAITITYSNVYPEGKVAIPITIINIGQLDEALNVDFILQPSTLMQTKTYYIKAGSSTTDTLYYDLKEGSYQLSAISQQPAVSAMADLSVRKENEVETSISLGAQTGGIIPATVNLTNVGYNNIEGSVQLSAVSSKGQIVWNGYHDVSLLSSLTPIPYPLTFNINSSSIEQGDYILEVRLLSNSNQQISISSQPLTIQGPVFQITQLPPSQTLTAGEKATFTFKIKNTGNKEGAFDFHFKAYDLIDSAKKEWLIPGEEKPITFSFMMPVDLEEKDYFADYELKDSTVQGLGGQIKFYLAGINLNVSATMDKENYSEGDTAKLTIFVDQSSLGTLNLFARVNYNDYESQMPFTLSTTETLIFDIPLTEITGEKLFYGIYHESGRSIHLNSLYIYKIGDVLTIMTDKQVYNLGETVSTTISSTSEASGTLILSAPNYSETFAFLETATKSFVLPSTMTAGTYFINAQLSTPNSELITVMYPFDVAGISVKVKEATLDKAKYATSDTLNTRLTIESNQDLSATLKAWIVEPEGKFISAGERNISLSSSDNLLVTHNSSLVTAVSGIHRLVYGIYAGDLLLVSGSEAFDVGDAILTGISTNKTDYPTNTEFVNVAVSMYGTVDAILELQLDGDTIRTQPIALNGFSTLDIDVGTVKPGTHALKATLSAGGLKSTKETTFTYALSLLDSDNDGMSDEWETSHGLDSNNPADANSDPDNDGLTNLQEYQHGTNPNNQDTDNDGMPDGWEVTYDLNPNANDASSDKDNDGFSNLQEYQSGSNPTDPTIIPNQPPVANAGADQNVITGTLVTLNGSESFDPEGALITFLWTFIGVPSGSNITDASLSDATSPKPTFTPDINGIYRLELVINDGVLESAPDEVAIIASAPNVAPNANAGPDQNAITGTAVYLDGNGSTDLDNGPLPLSYLWSFYSIPPVSGSSLTDDDIVDRNEVNASFIPDVDGTYTIKLMVSDGDLSSNDDVVITATTLNVPPNANAGPDITIPLDQTAVLDGSASNDPDSGPSLLDYSWIFLTVPAGSQIGNEDIIGADSVSPSFMPDVAGTYVLQLMVSDGLDAVFDNMAVTVIKKAIFCSILGNDPKPSILDQDIFKFNGIIGETVTIRLESDPAEAGSGKRATLLLAAKIPRVLFIKMDQGVLPNKISAKLPATGEYLITVAEQPKIAKGERYRGAYCLSLEASQKTMQTLKPAFWVE